VLLNLVGNALKFTERGEVVVRVTKGGEEREGVRLRFTVTDTGIGIKPEARKRLFQPFSQADGSITRKFGGTGLGLAISRQLVELMGGAIGVDSEAGRGSTFWFTVKLGVQPQALRVIPRRVDLAGRRALIVDDNQTNREILERQLNTWRVSTASAVDGESALALLRSNPRTGQPFDFALLDMQMPGMSGFELARRISADPSLTGLKMLVLTSMGSIPPFAETVAAGVSACLPKPVQQEELHEAIASLFGMGKPRVAARAGPPKPQPEPKSLRILLAEDNVVNQSVARMQLAHLGYKVEIVADGRAALDAVHAHSYDMVLMDCQMPEMDGYDATRQIRAWEQTRRAAGEKFTPLLIVAMTASAMAGDREACLAAGMDDYVSKPVQAGELAAAITRGSGKI
jgi:CheY-like chemotaxis protein